MQCKCTELQNCTNYGESEEEFVRDFEFVDEQPWLRLYRCKSCNTYWQLDVGDRSDFAIKVAQPENWLEFDDCPFRREFFVRFHGGEEQHKCIWAGCQNPALKGMAICVNHAYPEIN